jgi:hypothetical protein
MPDFPTEAMATAEHSCTAGTRCSSAHVGAEVWARAGCGTAKTATAQIKTRKAKERSRRMSLSGQIKFACKAKASPGRKYIRKSSFEAKVIRS